MVLMKSGELGAVLLCRVPKSCVLIVEVELGIKRLSRYLEGQGNASNTDLSAAQPIYIKAF